MKSPPPPRLRPTSTHLAGLVELVVLSQAAAACSQQHMHTPRTCTTQGQHRRHGKTFELRVCAALSPPGQQGAAAAVLAVNVDEWKRAVTAEQKPPGRRLSQLKYTPPHTHTQRVAAVHYSSLAVVQQR